MKYDNETAIEVLESTPRTLKAIVGNLSDEWTGKSVGETRWSPFDVVGHLIHGEKTDWIPRTKIILQQGQDRTFVPFDRFAQESESVGKTLKELLDEFETLRKRNVEELRMLNPTSEQLKLKGIHPEFGEVTLEELLAAWVVHDLTHIRQISVSLALKYKESAGIWKKYMTILQ